MPIKDYDKTNRNFQSTDEDLKRWKKGEGKTWAWKISRGRRLAKKPVSMSTKKIKTCTGAGLYMI